MMRLFVLFTLCLSVFAYQSNAQEICNNNLDDDGDGDGFEEDFDEKDRSDY